MKVEISFDAADEVVRESLKEEIIAKQEFINQAADYASDGTLAEEIKELWHLMHAYNYFSPPKDHYDVPY